MKLTEVFPSKYLKADDLQGKEPTVVIAKAEIEKLGEDNKLILYFKGKEKGLVVNRTNADRVAYLYGQDTDDWIGKEITLYTEMVNFQGRITQGLRVKPPGKKQHAHKLENKGKYDTLAQADPAEDGDGGAEDIPW